METNPRSETFRQGVCRKVIFVGARLPGEKLPSIQWQRLWLTICLRAETGSFSPSCLQEDVKYLCKFGIFSVVGAAAIKYGSLLFPNVTVPDLSLALVLVWSPVLASVFLLAVAGARQDPGSK